MIFGTNPVYTFAVYNKKKMHSLGKSYPFDEAPVPVKACPVKIVGQKAEIFFPGPIFNTYLESVETGVSVLKSYDERLTFIKSKLEENTLYTVKTVAEDDKTREVAIFEFDEFFPGLRVRGSVDLKDEKLVFTCSHGSGRIVMQSNDLRAEVDAMLVTLDASGAVFAEVNNPIERTTVRVVKDLKNNKIVENGQIKGILIDAKDRKIHEEVPVFVKNVYPGSYCFVEDILPGPAEVELIGREGRIYKVKHRHFTGTCTDKHVKKKMKGVISDIVGNTFRFRQESDERTSDFETLRVPKRMKVTDEAEIKSDQVKAIDYIKHVIEAGEEEKAMELFKKYIPRVKENDSLCLFYLQYLTDRNAVTMGEIKKILKQTSEDFPHMASWELNDFKVVEMIFKVKKSVGGYRKMLEHAEDKLACMKANPEFVYYSIRYAYEEMDTRSPKTIVEKIIDDSFRCWMLYARLEDSTANTRRIYKRMAAMPFKKHEMKELFTTWREFETCAQGNIEEVERMASEYVERIKRAG